MNLNRIINMIINSVIRQFVNRGVKVGMDAVSRGSTRRNRNTADDEAPQQRDR